MREMLKGNRGWLPRNKLVPQCMLSCLFMSNSGTSWTVACEAPLSMEFSRQVYWSELPFPSLGDLPNPGTEHMSPDSLALQADSLPLSHLGSWYLDNNILKMLLGDENLSKLIVAMVRPLCEYAIVDSFQRVNYISILLGRSPGERNGYQLQYSGLENSMGCIVHGVAKSRTRLSDFHLKLF